MLLADAVGFCNVWFSQYTTPGILLVESILIESWTTSNPLGDNFGDIEPPSTIESISTLIYWDLFE